jgi:hypothetical protein
MIKDPGSTKAVTPRVNAKNQETLKKLDWGVGWY